MVSDGGGPSSNPAAYQITTAGSSHDLAAVKALLRAYAASLDVDLAYQNFDEELAGLPGQYVAPAGALLLARGLDGAPLGCVALRAMADAGCCELKRLFVLPATRGIGLGRALVAAIVREAQILGYREIRLDSLPSMTQAIALYRKAGFIDAAPYYDTPIVGTVFLRQVLGSAVEH